MKNNLTKSFLLIAICIMGFSALLHAQSIYKVDDSKDNDIKLSGTSTFHNWSMNAQSFYSEAQFGFQPGNQLASINSLTFSLLVTNLKSGESGLDNNAYKALNTDKYKNISYTLTSATVSSGKGNKYSVKTHGNLTIAGVTKAVTMNVSCTVNNDATITCTGSYQLNMTDYQVSPPKFMLGMMKTGNAITLDFTSDYKK
jgi:polyisoprenoid-binding protein YceI